MSISRKDHESIVDDIFTRSELKPQDLPKASKYHLENKLGMSPRDHWIKFIGREYDASVTNNSSVYLLVDLITEASVGSMLSLYNELKQAIDNLSNGIDPALTQKKLASLTEVERQIIANDAKNKKKIEDEIIYKRNVRQQAIAAVFGEWSRTNPTEPYEAKK